MDDCGGFTSKRTCQWGTYDQTKPTGEEIGKTWGHRFEMYGWDTGSR